MKSPIESPFNDSGAADDPPYKKKFLAQRKWIIIISTFVLLLSQEYLSVNGSIGAISLSIDSNSIKLLNTLCVVCLLFGAYMFLQSYPYISKYSIEKRESFNKLQITNRDVYSDEIKSSEAQYEKVASEIQEKSDQIERQKSILDEVRPTLEQIFEQYPDIAEHSLPSELFSNALKSSDPFYQTEVSGLKPPRMGTNALSGDGDQNNELREKHAAKRQFDRLMPRAVLAQESVQNAESELKNLKADGEALRVRIRDAEVSRAKVTRQNNGRWRTYLYSSLGADLVSFIPSIAGILFCSLFLISQISHSHNQKTPPVSTTAQGELAN